MSDPDDTPATPARGGVAQRQVRVNGFRMAYLEAGPAAGPLALCLHGFPDHAWSWEQLLLRLADAGFHAVAPWTRGYHPTEVPPGRHFHPGALVADVVALHDALGGDGRAVVVGHDWGAIATHGATAAEPQRWRRAVALAVPPLRVWWSTPSLAQLRRSWYIGYFQLPVLPERALDHDRLERIWRASWRGVAEHPELLARLHGTFEAPGTVPSALGYYRDLFRPWRWASRWARYDRAAWTSAPRVPTLHLQGGRDLAVGTELLAPTRALLPAGSEVDVVAGGHWFHLERADEVSGRIVDFLTS